MNILIQLSHPAHFHLYKNVASNLIDHGHKVLLVIKTKDILEELIIKAGLPYVNINAKAHRKNRLGVLWDMFVRDWQLAKICYKEHIDLITGSTAEVAHIGFFLRLFSINTGEDDLPVVPLSKYFLAPFCQSILVPDVCEMERMNKCSVRYPSYHELAYLHPNHFQASKEVVRKSGINPDSTFFILRFASLTAHHDKGVGGINTTIATKLVEILKPYGRIYITSERPLEKEFEQYRISINPLDIHHVMAFASIYIGDSQTMAAEAGVLGVPFVRFNDFVGRIGYLRELEDVYHLGYGIRANTEPFTPKKVDWIDEEPKVQPCGAEAMYKVVEELMSMDADKRREIFQQRRQKMLSEKVDYAKFLTWFIENYPESKKQVVDSKGWWSQFK